MSSSSTSKSSASNIQEYVVRVPKGVKKKHCIMKFNAINNIVPSQWNQVRMERENNAAEFKTDIDDMPRFGAGSVYNNEQKQIARKKKLGIKSKNYNPDEQPWHLRIGGKNGKKYRGLREGGILDNASFYVFTEASDGAFEAFPIEEWYNFSHVARYKTLNAEEAEEEFGRRDKVLNYFSIMVKKRLKNEEDDVEGEGKEKAKIQSISELKISEIDDWTDESDVEISNDDSENEKKKKPKSKKKKKVLKEKRKKRGTDDEAEEDTDDIDEGQEVDYISNDSASSEEEIEKDSKVTKDDLKGVEDEEGLKIFDLSEDEDEENKEEKDDENADEKASQKNKDEKNKKSSKRDSSSDSSSDSSDSDNIDSDIKSAMFIQNPSKGKSSSDNSASSSRANTPTNQLKELGKKGKKIKQASIKRKAEVDDSESSNQSKKAKQESTVEGLNDESIRRYLMRKPITAAELFQKFKSKKCGMSDDQLASTIAAILKRMNLRKQIIKGKLYWSLKE